MYQGKLYLYGHYQDHNRVFVNVTLLNIDADFIVHPLNFTHSLMDLINMTKVDRLTGLHNVSQEVFALFFFFEMTSHCVAQTGLELSM